MWPPLYSINTKQLILTGERSFIPYRKPDLPFGSDHLLEEGAPIVPEPPLPNWKPNKKQYQTDGERIETAFRKYFRKADISHSSDINEIIVCHANVIR